MHQPCPLIPNDSPIIDNDRWYKINIDISNNQLVYNVTYEYVKELLYYQRAIRSYYMGEGIPDISYNDYKINEVLINNDANLYHDGKYNIDISTCSYIVINVDISGNGHNKYYVKIKNGVVVDYSNNINNDYNNNTYNIFKDSTDISFSQLINNYDNLKTNVLINSQPLTMSDLIYKDIYIANNNSTDGNDGVTYIYDISNSNNSGRPILNINNDSYESIQIENDDIDNGYDVIEGDILVFKDNNNTSKIYFEKEYNKRIYGNPDKYYYKIQEYNLENVYIKQLNDNYCEIWYDNQKCYDFSKIHL